MMLVRWAVDRYYMAYPQGDFPTGDRVFILKSAHGGAPDQVETFPTAAALVKRMAALSQDWWISGSAVLFSQGDLDFFLATEPLRRALYADEIVDYTGMLPFRYLVARPEGAGQMSFFDDEEP
jgi:hypothetical protein